MTLSPIFFILEFNFRTLNGEAEGRIQLNYTRDNNLIDQGEIILQLNAFISIIRAVLLKMNINAVNKMKI